MSTLSAATTGRGSASMRQIAPARRARAARSEISEPLLRAGDGPPSGRREAGAVWRKDREYATVAFASGNGMGGAQSASRKEHLAFHFGRRNLGWRVSHVLEFCADDYRVAGAAWSDPCDHIGPSLAGRGDPQPPRMPVLLGVH